MGNVHEKHYKVNRINLILSALIALCLIYIPASFLYTRSAEKDILARTESAVLLSPRAQQEAFDAVQRLDEHRLDLEKLSDLDKAIEDERALFFQKASLLEQMVDSGETDLKIAYLSFDDGPYNNTNQIMDVLKENGVQATFFAIGRTSAVYDSIWPRYAAECHTLGNHTYSHNMKSMYASSDAFIADILKQQEYLESRTGRRTDLCRFPGGSSQAKSRKSACVDALRENGYAYVDWNNLTGDAEGGTITKEGCISRVLDNTKNRKFLVVLMHDFSTPSLEALPEIIQGLRDQGYVFLPMFHDSMAVKR